jgi:hypothetical protein
MAGLDINAIKARMAQLSNRTKKSNDLWKPEDEHDVRAVPHPYSKNDDNFVELGFHYEIGNEKPILCPKVNFGDDCDICDFCDALKSWKTPDGEEKAETDRKIDWETFKKISVKSAWFFPVVVRGKESEGAKWHRTNQTNYNTLLGICVDEENNTTVVEGGGTGALGVLFDVNCAYDLHVSFKKKGEKGNTKTFNIVEFKEKKKPTPLAKTKPEIDKILASVKPIHDVYPKVTSEEVSKIFKKALGSAKQESEAEGGTEHQVNSNENAKTVGGRSVDEAFEDMLNE